MLERAKAMGRKLKSWPAGERFQRFHEQARQWPRWQRALLLAAALASFGIGVVLVFIPGPAVVFFALTGALIATQSAWLARKLDAAELKVRGWIRAFKRKRAQNRARRASTS